ncbi:MAG TPA: bifunctional riboflavin kinase/FAD synthetase [Thermoanaerobaculia bacterium]|nr:bifunctional riboflavin kinase/FAD synthetase [Thermoanaerobaculia bacterium]
MIRDPLKSAELPRGGVATIGNFDGLHLGHRKILEAVVSRAREIGKPSMAITFEPHPLAVLRPDQAPRRLQTLRQKEEVIESIGIDWLLVIPFTRDFSLTEPEDFVKGFLSQRLAVAELRIGEHFAFGRGKRGSLELLRKMGPELGFVASGVDEVLYKGEPISSTRIRTAIEAGLIPDANAMFGREYELEGIVSKGERVGRKIGYPTINLASENDLYPADGVYVTQIEIRSFGKRFDCVTNIGRRPTVYEDYATTIETYVLEFSSDVYGERVRLFFFDRLREERKFPSVMELTQQIGRDIETTKEYFRNREAGRGTRDSAPRT